MNTNIILKLSLLGNTNQILNAILEEQKLNHDKIHLPSSVLIEMEKCFVFFIHLFLVVLATCQNSLYSIPTEMVYKAFWSLSFQRAFLAGAIQIFRMTWLHKAVCLFYQTKETFSSIELSCIIQIKA